MTQRCSLPKNTANTSHDKIANFMVTWTPCSLDCRTESSYNLHMKGVKHMKKLTALTDEAELVLNKVDCGVSSVSLILRTFLVQSSCSSTVFQYLLWEGNTFYAEFNRLVHFHLSDFIQSKEKRKPCVYKFYSIFQRETVLIPYYLLSPFLCSVQPGTPLPCLISYPVRWGGTCPVPSAMCTARVSLTTNSTVPVRSTRPKWRSLGFL